MWFTSRCKTTKRNVKSDIKHIFLNINSQNQVTDHKSKLNFLPETFTSEPTGRGAAGSARRGRQERTRGQPPRVAQAVKVSQGQSSEGRKARGTEDLPTPSKSEITKIIKAPAFYGRGLIQFRLDLTRRCNVHRR